MAVDGIIIAIIMTGLSIFLFILYFITKTNNVAPNLCSSATTSYGVLPNTIGPPINSCGVAGNEECTFNVSSIKAAINQCDSDFGKCSSFMLKVITSDDYNITYIDPTQTIGSFAGDTYIRQRPISS